MMHHINSCLSIYNYIYIYIYIHAYSCDIWICTMRPLTGAPGDTARAVATPAARVLQYLLLAPAL